MLGLEGAFLRHMNVGGLLRGELTQLRIQLLQLQDGELMILKFTVVHHLTLKSMFKEMVFQLLMEVQHHL